MNLNLERPGQRLSELACTVLILFYGFLYIAQIYVQKATYPVVKVAFGLDSQMLFQGVEWLLHGVSPYPSSTSGVSTPPGSLLVLLPFSLISAQNAVQVLFGLLIVTALAGLLLSWRLFFKPSELRTGLLASFVLLLFSYPFHLSIDRGNIDILVLFLILSGVALVSKQRQGSGGILLGIATAMKLYPALLIFPLWIQGRRKAAATLAATALMISALTPQTTATYFSSSFISRISFLELPENASIAAAFLGVLRPLGLATGERGTFAVVTVSYLLFAVLLGLCLRFDFRNRRMKESASLLLYIPFLFAIPMQVYHYELVGLLFCLPALEWARVNFREEPSLRYPLLMAGSSLAISQFPAVSASVIFGSIVPHSIPAWGALGMIAAVTWMKGRVSA